MSRLLHHVSQVAGELQLAGAVHDVDLHLQDLAARLSPGQAVHHADLLPVRVEIRGIGLAVQELGELLLCHGNPLDSALQQAHIRLPADGSQPPLQQAHTGFPGVVPDDGPVHVVADAESALLQSVLCQLLGEQVALGDLQLLLIRVAGELDHLHPVQQGPGNGVCGVGGGDEHDLGQVHRDLQEMVPEGAVLLAVQHLQQCGGRVAPVVVAQLVDLVQQQKGIHRPAAADGLDDPAGHGAYVGLPMSPDVRLVPNAAQAQAGQLPVQRLGHADGNGGLAHAGRAHQAEDLPLDVRIHLPDGDGLQNPLLHLFQAEVVLFQHPAGGVHTDPLLCGGVPRHLQTHVQIVADHRTLGGAEGLLGQLVHFLQQVLLRLLRQLQGQDLLAVGFNLVLVAVIGLPQLVLEDPDLGAEDLVPLGADQLVPDLALHFVLKAQHVVLPHQETVELPQPGEGGEFLQDLLLVGVAQGDVLGNIVRQEAGVPAVHHRGHHLLRHTAGLLGILAEQGVGLAEQGLRPGALPHGLRGRLLRDGLHIGLEEGLRLPQAAQVGPLPPLHHHPDRGLAQPQDLRDVGDRANGVQVLFLRRVHPDLPLGHQEDVLIGLHGPLQGRDGDRPLHVKGQCHVWKHRQAPEGQNGQIPSGQFHVLVPF